MWKGLQALAIRHDGIGIAGSHFGGCGARDVAVQFSELCLRLGRENYRAGHQRVLVAFARPAESGAARPSRGPEQLIREEPGKFAQTGTVSSCENSTRLRVAFLSFVATLLP